MAEMFLDATTVLSFLALHLQQGREGEAENAEATAPPQGDGKPGQIIDTQGRGEVARTGEHHS